MSERRKHTSNWQAGLPLKESLTIRMKECVLLGLGILGWRRNLSFWTSEHLTPRVALAELEEKYFLGLLVTSPKWPSKPCDGGLQATHDRIFPICRADQKNIRPPWKDNDRFENMDVTKFLVGVALAELEEKYFLGLLITSSKWPSKPGDGGLQATYDRIFPICREGPEDQKNIRPHSKYNDRFENMDVTKFLFGFSHIRRTSLTFD